MDGSGEKERKKESNADTSVLPVALLKVITVHYTSPRHKSIYLLLSIEIHS